MTAEQYIAQFPGDIQTLLRSARQIVQDSSRGTTEYVERDMLAYALGPNTYKASVVVVAGHQHHITLGFYRGRELADPHRLLAGAGKKVRHYRIEGEKDIRKPQIQRWVRQALALAKAASCKRR